MMQANNDITVNSAISMTNSGVGLTMQAGRSVNVNANITTSNGLVDLEANIAFDPTYRSAGLGNVTMASGTTINSGSGGISLYVAKWGPSGGTITIDKLVTSGTVSVENNGLANGSILAAASDSLIQAGELSLDAGTLADSNAAGATIGTAALPIRVETPKLALIAASDIYVTAPFGDLTTGTVSDNSGIVSTLGGQINLSTAGSLYADSISTNGPTTGGPKDAGNVTINASDGVLVSDGLFTAGGLSGTAGGNGGNITINAGGNVMIGYESAPTLGSAAISVRGRDSGAGQTAGNGGSISIAAGTIDAPFGMSARGGDGAGNGGHGGSITLTATTGDVQVGTWGAGLVGQMTARGGNSQMGRGGNAGSIDVSGRHLYLGAAFAQGGDTKATTAGYGGAGGAITLTASATDGDAVTIFGNSSDLLSPSFGTLLSRGGKIGVTSLLAGTTGEIGGTVDGAGANILIQGVGGSTLGGAVRLVWSYASDLAGDSSFLFSSSGGAPGRGGAITIKGDVLGSVDWGGGGDAYFPRGTETLRLNAANSAGGVHVTGIIDQLATLMLSGDNSVMSFDGAVTASTSIADLRASGSATFGDTLTTPNLTMSAGTVTLNFQDASISESAILSGTINAPSLSLDAPVTLAGDTTINTTAWSGTISLGTVDGTHDLSLNAGRAVWLDTLGGSTALTGLSIVTGADLTLPSINVGRLSVTAGGSIRQSGALKVTGMTTLEAVGAPFIGADFGADVYVGGLSAESVVVTMPSGIDKDIVLTNSANDFSTVSITRGRNVSLADSNGFVLGPTTISGALAVSGSVGLAGNVTAAGSISLEAVNLLADVSLTTTASSSDSGGVMIGSLDGLHALSVNAGSGTTIIGEIGATTPVNSLVLSGDGFAGIWSITKLGLLDLRPKTGGGVFVGPITNLGNVATSSADYAVGFFGGGTTATTRCRKGCSRPCRPPISTARSTRRIRRSTWSIVLGGPVTLTGSSVTIDGPITGEGPLTIVQTGTPSTSLPPSRPPDVPPSVNPTPPRGDSGNSPRLPDSTRPVPPSATTGNGPDLASLNPQAGGSSDEEPLAGYDESADAIGQMAEYMPPPEGSGSEAERYDGEGGSKKQTTTVIPGFLQAQGAPGATGGQGGGNGDVSLTADPGGWSL